VSNLFSEKVVARSRERVRLRRKQHGHRKAQHRQLGCVPLPTFHATLAGNLA
jgi:hypothetical protein